MSLSQICQSKSVFRVLGFVNCRKGIWELLFIRGPEFIICRCCSVTKSCLNLCDLMNCSIPGFLVLHYLPAFAQTHVHWVSDAIQPFYPLSPLSPPALNLSQHQGLFQWVGSLHQVAKVLELQLQHQSFNDYLGLISFRVDWFDILAVQGTLNSLLQHHISKASILWCSALFMVQLFTSIHDCWKSHSFD